MNEIKKEMEELALEGFKALKEAGIRWVEWCAAGDGKECEACAAENGKIVKLSTIAQPWHAGCENEYCRCVLIAATKP